jgi:hypothetical protein
MTDSAPELLGIFPDQATVTFDQSSPTRLQANIDLFKAISTNTPVLHGSNLIQFGAAGWEADQIGRMKSNEPGENSTFSAYLIPSQMVPEDVRASRKEGVLIVRDHPEPDNLADEDIAQAYIPIEIAASLYPQEDVVQRENLSNSESVNRYFLPKLEGLRERDTQTIEDHRRVLETYQVLEGLWIGLAREGRLSDLEEVMKVYAGEIQMDNDPSSIATFIGREKFIGLDPLREAWIAYQVGRTLGELSFSDFSTYKTDLAAFVAAYEFLIEKFTTRSHEVLAEVLYPVLLTAQKGLTEEKIGEKMYDYVKSLRGLIAANNVKDIWDKKFASTESE